jgi:hypothetical protein
VTAEHFQVLPIMNVKKLSLTNLGNQSKYEKSLSQDNAIFRTSMSVLTTEPVNFILYLAFYTLSLIFVSKSYGTIS